MIFLLDEFNGSGSFATGRVPNIGSTTWTKTDGAATLSGGFLQSTHDNFEAKYSNPNFAAGNVTTGGSWSIEGVMVTPSSWPASYATTNPHVELTMHYQYPENVSFQLSNEIPGETGTGRYIPRVHIGYNVVTGNVIQLALSTSYLVKLKWIGATKTAEVTIDGVLICSITNAGFVGTDGRYMILGGAIGWKFDSMGISIVDQLPAPVPVIEGYGGGTLISTSPTPVILAGSSELYSQTVIAPLLQAIGYGGGIGSVILPTIKAVGYSTGNGNAILPVPTVFGAGHNSLGENSLTYVMAAPLASGYGGGWSEVAITPSLDITGTVTIMGQCNLRSPKPKLDITGAVSILGSASLEWAPGFEVVAFGGGAGGIRLTKPARLEFAGTTGALGGSSLSMPRPLLVGSGTLGGVGKAMLVAPSAALGSAASCFISAYPARVVAQGGIAQTAPSYLSYAVNLKHTTGLAKDERLVFEVTQYANFGFTSIFRNADKYYAINQDGLFLLGGDTDAGAPIEYEVTTGFSDFGSSNLKTIKGLYVGGRFGNNATLYVITDEETRYEYAFSTPREPRINGGRQVLGKGIRSRYQALGFSGSETFVLSAIDLDISKLNRSI